MVIFSCIDLCVLVEIVLDVGIGEMFNFCVVGNISNCDMLGSMEFVCVVVGVKVVLVIGYICCGVVCCVIDNVELGNLMGLLDEIKFVIVKMEYSGECKGSNYDFVDVVV